VIRLDADPGEQPRPDEDPSQGLETEDELAEDLTPAPRRGLETEDLLEGASDPDPEPDEDGGGGGMETEEETRSPGAGGAARLVEPGRR
jgi:hypothetical protein